MKEYKEFNGISFDSRTPDRVCAILANAWANNQRVRVFYGDTETGEDWCEVYNTIGRVGRSTGRVKIPLIIHSSRSIGRPAILDTAIVKITIDKETVYKHPNYVMPLVKKEGHICHRDPAKAVPYFSNPDQRKIEREYAFFLGERNSH